MSKKKVRYVDSTHNFNLDLTYIPTGVPFPDLAIDDSYSDGKAPKRTQMIAMGFPSEGAEGLYRNPIKEVRRFFNTFHRDKFKIYNLCSEKAYDVEKLFNPDDEESAPARTARFGFDDHNPPPLALILPFCQDLQRWLNEDPEHVASIHCKAGKGRTGTLICAYLVHSGRYTADEALLTFGQARTANGKGVTIPSQHRYVHYFEQCRLRDFNITEHTYQISHIRFVTVPAFDGHGCDLYFTAHIQTYKEKDENHVSEQIQIYDYREFSPIRHFKKEDRFADMECGTHGLLVKGDVRIQFYDKDSNKKIFHFWFNTAFVENNYLCFEKAVLDKACKDKENKLFDPNFRLEIFMHRCDTIKDFSVAAPTVSTDSAVDNYAPDAKTGMTEVTEE